MKKASKYNKEIEKINKKLASMSLSREERNNYEFRLKAIRDEISAIDYATKKGLEEGRRKGLEQGIVEGLEQGLQQGLEQGIQQGIQQGVSEGEKNAKIEIAEEMLKNNFSIEEIQKITRLSLEEIKKIKINN